MKYAIILLLFLTVLSFMILQRQFFNRDTQQVAQDLLGKVICVKHQHLWLKVQIIETEAYYQVEKASHASLGFTEKRKALFMAPGTIYMYYARGGDSLNFSCQGDGNAVLIKSGIPFVESNTSKRMIIQMQSLNPAPNGKPPRSYEALCRGQTLLCKALGLKVPDWDQKSLNKKCFYVADVGYTPHQIIQTTRLGIPSGRDGHLPYRYIDHAHAHCATKNPLRQGKCEYQVIVRA